MSRPRLVPEAPVALEQGIPLWASVGLWLALFAFARPASAQSLFDTKTADPKACQVVVENLGNFGFRISDAQAVAEAVISSLRKRLGQDAVVYEGARAAAAEMKKLLGPSAETQIQDTQLAYYDAAEKNAPFRVVARFGKDKGKGGSHFITVACRKAGTDPKRSLDEKRFTGKTFLQARDALQQGLPSFCPALTAPMALPIEGATRPDGTPLQPPGLHKPTPNKDWTPPPRRD